MLSQWAVRDCAHFTMLALMVLELAERAQSHAHPWAQRLLHEDSSQAKPYVRLRHMITVLKPEAKSVSQPCLHACMNRNELAHHRTRHRRFETSSPSAHSPEHSNGTTFSANTTLETQGESFVEFRDSARFWVQRVLVPLLMVVGVVGNSITIAIMTRRRMRSSTNWYLAVLATFDMLYLVATFVLSLKHYPNAHHAHYYWYWRALPWAMMLADTSSNTSVWLTVTFTIERYIAVCHPIKGKAICTESRAKKVCGGVFLICASVTLPTPFEWVVVEQLDPKHNVTTYKAVFSELGSNDTYKNIYYHLNVLLFTLIPLILLAIFNAFLVRSVNQANRQRGRMMAANDDYHVGRGNGKDRANNESGGTTSSSRQETRITVMLISVVVLFLVCQTPTACMLVFNAIDPDTSTSTLNLLTGLNNIFNLLLSINSAGNFVLYCFLSQTYRRTFMAMFCPCLAPPLLGSKASQCRGPCNIGHSRHRLDQNLSTSDRSVVAFESSSPVPSSSNCAKLDHLDTAHGQQRVSKLTPAWRASRDQSAQSLNGMNKSDSMNCFDKHEHQTTTKTIAEPSETNDKSSPLV